MTAATEGHGDIVDELVGVGADVDARNEQGCTALIMAAHNGYAGESRPPPALLVKAADRPRTNALARQTSNSLTGTHTDVTPDVINNNDYKTDYRPNKDSKRGTPMAPPNAAMKLKRAFFGLRPRRLPFSLLSRRS